MPDDNLTEEAKFPQPLTLLFSAKIMMNDEFRANGSIKNHSVVTAFQKTFCCCCSLCTRLNHSSCKPARVNETDVYSLKSSAFFIGKL